ncbi:ABC transporter permease [Cohnella silvisoli]|uniref:ABC transporter permease n=1 Tax=Cohnella silvisoli TaxID=2873699 RepID=A0ABV1KR81_9BACL|nr:ABC transporter permease [Cohnella silvisoli]MCD9024509.1 ABC transporter permease [Cohnella silvisoli]
MKHEDHTDGFHIKRFSPFPLFLERMSAYWVAIWKCWRTVLDWAVWLYIFIPGLLIIGGMYRDLVRNPPQWLHEIPVALLLTILGLLQLTGKYRTFAEPGDGLFLHRNARWLRGLTAAGFIYGFITRIFLSSLIAAVLSPLLLEVFEFSGSFVIILVIYSAIYGFVWMLLRDRLMQKLRGWQLTIILLMIRPVFLSAFVWLAVIGDTQSAILVLASVFMLTIAFWQMMLRLRTKGTLLHEIAVENAAYVASVGWILSETMDKKPVPKLRRPMLFRQSQPLLKHRDDADRLLDSWFKSVLRRFDLLKPLLYLAGAGAAAMLLSPLPLAVIVWLVLPMLLLGMLQRQWLQWLSEPYIALFRWPDDILERASAKAKIWGAYPLVSLWGIIVGVKTGLIYGSVGWLAIVVIPVAGYYWLRFVNEVVTSFSALRRKKE